MMDMHRDEAYVRPVGTLTVVAVEKYVGERDRYCDSDIDVLDAQKGSESLGQGRVLIGWRSRRFILPAIWRRSN